MTQPEEVKVIVIVGLYRHNNSKQHTLVLFIIQVNWILQHSI